MDETEKLIKLATVVGKLKEQVNELSNKADTIIKLEGPQGIQGPKGDKGDQGPQGLPGRDGKDGVDGVDGKDGQDGKDGVGVEDAYVDFDNNLVLKLSDGQEINAGEITPKTKEASSVYVSHNGFSLENLPSATAYPFPSEMVVKQNNEWVRVPFSNFASWLGISLILTTEAGDNMLTEDGNYIAVE